MVALILMIGPRYPDVVERPVNCVPVARRGAAVTNPIPGVPRVVVDGEMHVAGKFDGGRGSSDGKKRSCGNGKIRTCVCLPLILLLAPGECEL